VHASHKKQKTNIIIIIRFYGLSKQLAFIAQLVVVHEFLRCPVNSDGASTTFCGNRFQQFTTLAKEAHSAKFQ